MRENNGLKKKVIDELSNASEKDVILKSILKEEPKEILGEEFTDSVLKAVKTTKKAVPLIRLTRVALPFAACAAAVLIFVSVGSKGQDNSPMTKDIDTVKVEGDAVISKDLSDSAEEDFELMPTDDISNEVPATADTPMNESETDAEINEMPTSTGTSSRKEHQETNQESEKTYGMSVENSQEIITAFSSVNGDKNASNEIVIKISAPYYGKAIFGRTVYIPIDGPSYEMIVTSEKEIAKSELIGQLNAYTTNLCNIMNTAENSDRWKIEVIAENLPSIIEPNTVIKIIRSE